MEVEEYIYKAEKIFISEGFDNFSMEWISKKIGTTKRSLYNNFESREDLLKSVIHARKERIKNLSLPMFSEYGKSSIDIFCKWFNELSGTISEYQKLFIPSLKNKFPMYYEYLEHAFGQHCREFLALLIPRGRDEGLIIKNFNIDSYAIFVCNEVLGDGSIERKELLNFLIHSIITEQGLKHLY